MAREFCGRLFDCLRLFCAASVFSIGNLAQVYAQNPGSEDAVLAGVAARNRGNIQLSIDLLGKALSTAASAQSQTWAAAELGASLLQARRLDEAEKFLKQAYAASADSVRAKIAVDLGNLAVIRRELELARYHYEDAEKSAANNQFTRLVAGLNRATVIPESEKLATLASLFQEIDRVAEGAPRARLHLNLGFQAKKLGEPGLELAYRSFNEAYRLAPQSDKRLRLDASDAMAQLYEERGRTREALLLTEKALAPLAGDGEESHLEDILVRLEWRKGRLLRLEGRSRDALTAFRNAAAHLEAIRPDVPIEYEDGRSSFEELLRPVFTGLADLVLVNANMLPEQEQAGAYRTAIKALELTKQSEMQDYLGDRCLVETVSSDAQTAIPPGSAVLYPVLLPDRLELLLQTEAGILRRTIKVGGTEVADLAVSLARDLPRYWTRNYLPTAQRLYDLMLGPFESEFAKHQIQTLVIVPDGPLRLIPIGALHDGQKHAIERFAVSTVTGMSMTIVQAPGRGRIVALLAGLSEPGPVVAKLAARNINFVLGGTSAGSTPPASVSISPQIRSVRSRATQSGVDRSAVPPAGDEALRESLSLPGVKDEIRNIGAVLPNVSILNQGFTLGRFREEVKSGDYRILHIASHGIFGGSASSSFIMTYDDLLTMNGLESLLKENQADTSQVELMTLSACETAEGNVRAPLGISGAAIKAKARSVLGTLWPVGDEAARKVMERFYAGLAGGKFTKTQALQAAQKVLLEDEALAHPFFWAPFVLIGNWL